MESKRQFFINLFDCGNHLYYRDTFWIETSTVEKALNDVKNINVQDV